MGKQHLEHVQVEEAMHHLHITAGETEMADDAVIPQLDEAPRRAPPGRVESLVEGVLGVVQVDQREVVQAESFHALLNGASNATGGVVAVLPVDLGGDPDSRAVDRRRGGCLHRCVVRSRRRSSRWTCR